MRLLNVHTTELEYFLGDCTPPYAILSHTWGKEEVTLQDVTAGRARELLGFAKIWHCCRVAMSDGLDYVWIDTCCIDKTSSAELTEAINSMFRWYRQAEVCYGFLNDLKTWSESDSSDRLRVGDRWVELGRMRVCRWFYRGWTLQELIAPPRMIFFESSWLVLGTRAEIADEIMGITGVPISLLAREKPLELSSYSVARKMSWAAGRHTTRVEDRAYSLLGLFGVSMPMLYGEGEQAFRRLQEEIMKSSTDHSIFAWGKSSSMFRKVSSGFLAKSPSDFHSCSAYPVADVFDLPPYFITNKGVQISLPAVTDHKTGNTVILNCSEDKKGKTRVGLEVYSAEGQLRRGKMHEVPWDDGSETMKSRAKVTPQFLYLGNEDDSVDLNDGNDDESERNRFTATFCTTSPPLKHGYYVTREDWLVTHRSQEPGRAFSLQLEDNLLHTDQLLVFSTRKPGAGEQSGDGGTQLRCPSDGATSGSLETSNCFSLCLQYTKSFEDDGKSNIETLLLRLATNVPEAWPASSHLRIPSLFRPTEDNAVDYLGASFSPFRSVCVGRHRDLETDKMFVIFAATRRSPNGRDILIDLEMEEERLGQVSPLSRLSMIREAMNCHGLNSTCLLSGRVLERFPGLHGPEFTWPATNFLLDGEDE
ncbi:hypothetical protein MKZ38_000130 [Zalerion maritima]|uniref:HET-domain-containing protein n=1 Tax=Zalerion maritima TaxID=339359 RepID=A0AAD5RRU5_9PEZI|nr:hypothetical protein MKZ38_000130 [Zalerion maritima]